MAPPSETTRTLDLEPASLGLPASHLRSVEKSRRALLGSVADSGNVTFVRSFGNHGDELIFAGTRALLSELDYQEIGLEDIPQASGATAVLAGGGGWCQPFHELMPTALRLLESRFEKIVVAPSSFDPSVPWVRETLRATKALVFAREAESYRRIQGLCRASLAHDCAFYFDFAPYRRQGEGTLDAFRTDGESAGEIPLPADNRDISLECVTLEEWLETIASHARVRTDRAHVMIAGALLGKEVEFASSSYHKVPAIASFALGGFPVRRLEGSPPDGLAEGSSSAAEREAAPDGFGRVPGEPYWLWVLTRRQRELDETRVAAQDALQQERDWVTSLLGSVQALEEEKLRLAEENWRLERENSELRRAEAQLAACRKSKWWVLAELYWRARRKLRFFRR